MKSTPSPTPADVTALRHRHGLNQTEFGKLVYSSLRSVQHWESGAREMHPGLWELANIKLNRPTEPTDATG